MDVNWLSEPELDAWVRLAALVELLPGVVDAQLRRDADLSHFEYLVLAMLSEAPGRNRRMTSLATMTNATLPRLSHVVSRLACRGLVERVAALEDRRATDVHLTPTGWAKLRATAPGHVATVRENVMDALTPEQVLQLTAITDAILRRVGTGDMMRALDGRFYSSGRCPTDDAGPEQPGRTDDA